MTDSSCFRGTRGLSSMPMESSQALLPACPKRSLRASRFMAATSPRVCRPKRCISAAAAAGTGSRSTGRGARKPAASGGTMVVPRAGLVRAATRAGNLASPTPTRGCRPWETAFSRAGHQRVLTAVHGLQPVEAHVGRARSGPLHPVADSLQGEEHLVEHPAVGGLVRFQNGAVDVPGQGPVPRSSPQPPRRRRESRRRPGADPWSGRRSGRPGPSGGAAFPSPPWPAGG